MYMYNIINSQLIAFFKKIIKLNKKKIKYLLFNNSMQILTFLWRFHLLTSWFFTRHFVMTHMPPSPSAHRPFALVLIFMYAECVHILFVEAYLYVYLSSIYILNSKLSHIKYKYISTIAADICAKSAMYNKRMFV